VGGPPSQLGCALGSLGQSLARVKIWGGSTPWGPRCSLPRKIHSGGSMLANKTVLFVDQSSPDFYRRTREESQSITFLSDFGYLVSFRRHSRSKSKVVKNRAEFWTFFSSSQILGGRSSKRFTHIMTPVSGNVVWKMFCGDTATRPEVIVANMLNFKPNFKFSRLKFFWGTRPSWGVR